MCKYCEKETILIEAEENDADVTLNGNKLILNAYGYKLDHIEFDINFCPMCGRDLREPTEK